MLHIPLGIPTWFFIYLNNVKIASIICTRCKKYEYWSSYPFVIWQLSFNCFTLFYCLFYCMNYIAQLLLIINLKVHHHFLLNLFYVYYNSLSATWFRGSFKCLGNLCMHWTHHAHNIKNLNLKFTFKIYFIAFIKPLINV